MRLIAANWKMNPGTRAEAKKLAAQVEAGLKKSKIEVAICPPFVFLEEVEERLKKAKLGAQNVSAEIKGPHTGEVSATQLKDLGVKYVIVGHSERRAMGETDILINRKIKVCLENGLEPILCVGYGTTENTTEASERKIISKQLGAALKGVNNRLTIAYEPAWTISKGFGTAKPISPERAAKVIKFIKSKYRKARVIYGASITSKNAGELAKFKAIEGGLVGGASLDAGE